MPIKPEPERTIYWTMVSTDTFASAFDVGYGCRVRRTTSHVAQPDFELPWLPFSTGDEPDPLDDALSWNSLLKGHSQPPLNDSLSHPVECRYKKFQKRFIRERVLT
jgi:hypothetical protein